MKTEDFFNMNNLTVDLGDRSYPIVLGNTADWIELLCKKLSGRTALIVTDENVDAAGHLEKLEKALEGRFSPLNYVTKADVEQEIEKLKKA